MLMMQQEHRWSSGLGRMARAELMLSLLEGLLSGTVSSCRAGRSIVTTEAAGSAVRCLVPVKTPRANDSRGKAEKVGNQHREKTGTTPSRLRRLSSDARIAVYDARPDPPARGVTSSMRRQENVLGSLGM